MAADAKAQKRLRKALAAEFTDEWKDRVICVVPEEIPALLNQALPPAPTTATVAGYKVNVQFSNGPSDAGARRQALQSVIGKSLKRLSQP